MPYPNPRKVVLEKKSEVKQSPDEKPLQDTDKNQGIKGLDGDIDEILQQNPYYLLAKEASAIVEARFPYGAINQVAVAERLALSDDELTNILSLFSTHEHYASKFNVKRMADIAQPILFANCGLLTYYAVGHLKNKYPKILVEGMNLEYHNLLLLGRNPKSNPTDITSWGTDALICDLWASQYYLASDFLEQRLLQPHIPYYSLVAHPLTLKHAGVKKITQHYLSGNPRVFDSAACYAYDDMIAAWVAEDQRRWDLPLKSSLSTPASVKAVLDRDSVKSALAKLTHYDAWIFNQAKGIALCECSDVKRIKRIADALIATKAMVVTVTKRSDNGMPVVKCECIEFDVIQRLAEALYRKPLRESLLELQTELESLLNMKM